jgi:hypothetical protein
MLNKLKQYWLPFLFIGAGAVLIVVIWKVEIKWLSFSVFLIAAIFIILGLMIAGNIAEADAKLEHPDYDQPIGKMSLLERVVHYGSYVVAFLTYVLFKMQGKRIENVIEEGKFAIGAISIGIVLAVVIYHAGKRIYPVFFRSNKERQASIFVYCLAIIAWNVFGLITLNEWNTLSRTEKVSVIRKGKNARYGTRYLFLHIKGEQRRFTPSKEEWMQIQGQDSIFVTIAEGNLGFDVAKKFQPQDIFRAIPQTAH